MASSAAARTATETRREAAGARAERRAPEPDARREVSIAGAPATACVTADIATGRFVSNSGAERADAACGNRGRGVGSAARGVVVARAVRLASGRSTIRGLFRLISSRWIARARKSATGTNQQYSAEIADTCMGRSPRKTRHQIERLFALWMGGTEKSAHLADVRFASYNNVREGGFGWRHWARRDVRARTPPRGAGCVDAPPTGSAEEGGSPRARSGCPPPPPPSASSGGPLSMSPPRFGARARR